MRPYHLLVGLIILALPGEAGGQPVTFHDGLVTVQAKETSTAQLLSAWARVGGTEIVNGDKVNGVLTITLVQVPEVQALQVLLQSVAGYVVVPRKFRGTASESIYERILILPSSSSGAIQANMRPAERAAPSEPWPMPVNEELVFDDPIPVVVIDAKNARQDAWPMPVNWTLVLDDPPPTKTKGVQLDAWPMPVNDFLDDDDRVVDVRALPPGPDVWPMPVNADEDLDLTTETPQTTVVVDEESIPPLPERPPRIGLRTVPGVELAGEPAPANQPSAK